MRRLISYSILSAAMLLGIGISSVPIIEQLNTDMAYSDAKTLYFRASVEDPSSTNGNYGVEGEFLPAADKDVSSNYIIDDIADTMRKRMDNWSSSEYSLKVIGHDTIAITLRTSRNTDTQYKYIQDYLCFSGGDYDLDATEVDHDNYPDLDAFSDIIDGVEARIENYTLGTGVELPTVVIPLKEGETYQTAFRELVTYCQNNTKEAETDEEGKETSPATSCNLVIWANRKETDLYSNVATDANVASRVLCTVSAATAKYVPDSDAEKEENEQTLSLRIVPPSAAIGSDGQYNSDKGAEAYEAANFYLNMFNASSYSYQTSSTASTRYHVSYLYSEKASASVEQLVKLGDWYMSPALTRTLIATLVAIVLLVVGLVFMDRVASLAGIVASLGTGFISFAIFYAFGSQFNVAALIALGVNALVALFGYLYQQSRVKVELYRGRTLKKANQEAAKKSLWPILDAGIITTVTGICVYFLGGVVASKAGVMLAIGGIVSILVNLIVTRFLMWELANDDTAQSAFPKWYNVKKDAIPDPLKDEKQSYFGPFDKTDFKKNRKVGLIATAAILLASIGTSIGFGVANGTPFNDTTLGATTSLIQLDIRSEEEGKIAGTTAEKLYSVAQLKGYDSNNNPRLLETIKIDDKLLSTYVKDIELSATPKTVYTTEDSGDGTKDYWFYYTISLNTKLSDEDGVYTFKVYDGTKDAEGNLNYAESSATNVSDLLTDVISERFVSEPDDYRVSLDAVKTDAAQPYVWQMFLSLGVAIAAITAYLMIRFRPGKGLALGLVSAATGFLSFGIFALTRIPVNPTVSLGAIAATVVTLLLGIFLLNSTKELEKESKEKERSTFEFHRDNFERSFQIDGGNVLYLLAVASYILIVFFGFGPSYYSMPYASAFLGVLLGGLILLFGYASVGNFFMKLFSKIKFTAPRRKKKKKVAGQLMKKKGAEPEESIFIGIND
ncbi:MAG: hypothetical protein K6B65_04760 [Bacilli bacterium]|nr:hypothetical protein [Bacilli bacterium]